MPACVKWIIILVAAAMVFIAGCTGNAPERNGTLDKLEGTWVDTTNSYVETWSNKEGSLLGTGMTIDNGDTLFEETLRITHESGRIYYFAKVAGQNEDRSVRFVLESSGSDSFSFVNKDHDFPQRITYTFNNNDQLKVTVGNIDGTREFELKMERLK